MTGPKDSKDNSKPQLTEEERQIYAQRYGFSRKGCSISPGLIKKSSEVRLFTILYLEDLSAVWITFSVSYYWSEKRWLNVDFSLELCVFWKNPVLHQDWRLFSPIFYADYFLLIKLKYLFWLKGVFVLTFLFIINKSSEFYFKDEGFRWFNFYVGTSTNSN